MKTGYILGSFRKNENHQKTLDLFIDSRLR